VRCRDVTEHLQLLLRKSGYHLHTSAEKEVVRMISKAQTYSHPPHPNY
jgi:centractin